MTDRVKGCWVAFDHDMRIDDVEQTIDAIRQIRNVIAVDTLVSKSDDWVIRQRIGLEIRDQLLALVESVFIS